MDTLTATFFAHLPSRPGDPGTRPAPEAGNGAPANGVPAELPRLLLRLDTAARAAWPQLALSATRFIAYLAERMPREPGDLPSALAEIHAEDLYLACACVDGAPGAIEAFRTRHHPVVGEVLRAIDPAPAFADEVEQVLLQRLFVTAPAAGDGAPDRHPRIASYSGRGPLAGWLGIAAQRTAISLRRGEAAQRRARERAMGERLSIDLDPELLFLKQRYRVEFGEAFERAVAGLSDHDRALLRLHMVAGLTLDRIAVIYRVNASTVSRWLATTRARLSAETEKDLRVRLHLSPAEFDSLARLVVSQIDLSIARWLQDPKTESGKHQPS